jgi:hypothetical protein
MEKINVNGRVVTSKCADNLVNLSFVFENTEYEVTMETEDFFNNLMKTLQGNKLTFTDAEIFTHPACCEHPEGCP